VVGVAAHALILNNDLNLFVTIAHSDRFSAVGIRVLTVEKCVADSNDHVWGIIPITTSTKSNIIPGQLTVVEALSPFEGGIRSGTLCESIVSFSRVAVVSDGEDWQRNGEERRDKKAQPTHCGGYKEKDGFFKCMV